MTTLFAAVRESGVGTQRRFRIARSLVAVGIEADILETGKC